MSRAVIRRNIFIAKPRCETASRQSVRIRRSKSTEAALALKERLTEADRIEFEDRQFSSH